MGNISGCVNLANSQRNPNLDHVCALSAFENLRVGTGWINLQDMMAQF